MASCITERSIQNDLYAQVQINFQSSGIMCYTLFLIHKRGPGISHQKLAFGYRS